MARTPSPERTVYGHCRAAPQIGTIKTGAIVRFDLVQADTGRLIEILAWPPATTDLTHWLADLTVAPVIRVQGRFRLIRPGPAGQRGWRVHASEIEIGPSDNGGDRISGPRAYAHSCASHPAEPNRDYPVRTLSVGRAMLRPMQRHRAGFAIAFEANARSGAPIDVIMPVDDDADPGDLVALSGRLSRAWNITLTGYFRPSVLRGEHVLRWGFVASACEIKDAPPPRPKPPVQKPSRDGSPARRARPRKPAPPAPEPQSQGLRLLDLSSAERESLAGLGLGDAAFQRTIRSTLDALGCRSLADVADLGVDRLRETKAMAHRQIVLCRRALQDRLAALARKRARGES